MKKNNQQEDRLSKSKVLEIGSLSEVPADLIARYLKTRVSELMFVEVLCSKYFKRGSDFLRVSFYRSGKLERTFKYGASWRVLPRFSLISRIIFYLLCFPLVLITLLRLRIRFDIFIAINAPFPLVGLILRRVHLVRKAIFVSGNHLLAPRSINIEAIFTRIYRFVDKLALNSSDAVWYLSSRTMEAKEREGFLRNRKINRLIVPIAVDSERLKNNPGRQIERASIGYVGEVSESTGLHLAIEALTEVKRKVPDVKLKIIGSGVFQDNLEEKAKELGLGENVEFLGFIGDKDRVMDIISSCALSLALYIPGPTRPIQFTDSAKAKEYMECGIPIIITKVPEIALEIEEKRAGFAVEYDKEEIAEAMIKLLTDDELWQECRENIRQLAIKYDYKKIYDEAFSRLGIKPW